MRKYTNIPAKGAIAVCADCAIRRGVHVYNNIAMVLMEF